MIACVVAVVSKAWPVALLRNGTVPIRVQLITIEVEPERDRDSDPASACWWRLSS